MELGATGQGGLAVVQAAQTSALPPPVILLGYQKTPLPALAFQLEVADYLLLPQAGTDAVRRVARALGRPHRRNRTETEARLAALNLKALLRVKEMALALNELLPALLRTLKSPELPLSSPILTASDQRWQSPNLAIPQRRVIDLEVLA